MSRIELRLHPDPALLRVMRMTIMSAARCQGLDEALIDDMRLAATEAAAEAIATHEHGEVPDAILVGLDTGEREVVVRVEYIDTRVRTPAGQEPTVDRLAVATGLADDFKVRRDLSGETCIEMRWSRNAD